MASAISGGNRKRHQRCDRQQNGEGLTSRVRLGQHHRQRAEADEPELQADILADGTPRVARGMWPNVLRSVLPLVEVKKLSD